MYIRGQPRELSSLFPPHRTQGSNPGLQAWRKCLCQTELGLNLMGGGKKGMLDWGDGLVGKVLAGQGVACL